MKSSTTFSTQPTSWAWQTPCNHPNCSVSLSPCLLVSPSPSFYNPVGFSQASGHCCRRSRSARKCPMLARKPIFPNVIEMNYQAGQRLGCNVYLVYDGSDWMLIDIGFDETRRGNRRADPAAGFSALQVQDARSPRTPTSITSRAWPRSSSCSRPRSCGHPLAAEPLEAGDKIQTFAEIEAQNIHLEMPPVKIDRLHRRRRQDRGRRAEARSLAHARPHRQPALLPPGRPAVQRRQHLSRRLRRRDRRPSRQRHSGVHQVAAADPRQRRRSGCCPATARSSARTTPCSTRRSPGSKAICTWPTSAPAPSTGR